MNYLRSTMTYIYHIVRSPASYASHEPRQLKGARLPAEEGPAAPLLMSGNFNVANFSGSFASRPFTIVRFLTFAN